ncbi:multicomponent Na+:H+ antiporter subunit E [Cytobacillus horneckiae]|uniref:Na+/H+ antiporter subunit E n=1 Tax=Cytobacillus horneckiae TaxID=549687 RepID=A0A2N0ZE78_9BACI|nr:Na+/H+ antiporter subunit E [Cytobacillus horneckiae]NRG44389.1 Na+/H+ antiporter subunit E [Bacillus sp. CRN 9]MBN6889046.1 Na+/H+ antiporter subunit E [Cytobacillus horneckiae]MCM3180765.1 Na+/H+ antiporter subunit E [Cytobacillus horneckiae]MEC1157528.1 Na+/H+ antiporter subunit E [Cytobacillus horneckiae]MED2939476.1 Na+/H+ antiporter subunit E [Cytobacillus horneckiae]
MAKQVLLNVFLGFMWMFLTTTYEPVAFVKGYIFGLLIIFVFRKFFDSRFYLYRVFSFIKLALIFIKELIMANIAVVKVVLKPKMDMTPGIFAYPTSLEKDWEITTLANLITLTPGTMVIDISEDKKILFVHAIDIKDAKAEIDGIKESFEKAIMEVSRT